MEKAIAAIEAQQKQEKGRTAPWMVGEQLKDMLRREPGLGELVHQDLTTGGMSLREAEKRIKGFADEHKTGTFACVTPAEAEKIIREYFGMPEAGGNTHPSPSATASPVGSQAAAARTEGVISLEDFF